VADCRFPEHERRTGNTVSKGTTNCSVRPKRDALKPISTRGESPRSESDRNRQNTLVSASLQSQCCESIACLSYSFRFGRLMLTECFGKQFSHVFWVSGCQICNLMPATRAGCDDLCPNRLFVDLVE
jgi:hypothetical protein